MVIVNGRQVTVRRGRSSTADQGRSGPGCLRQHDAGAHSSDRRSRRNMEAMKHNFLLRGFFNRRGYFDLGSISPVDYRTGVLENGKRKAMRIWLKSSVLFEVRPDGTEVLTEDGRARIDSAMSTYLKYLPSNPIVVEG